MPSDLTKEGMGNYEKLRNKYILRE